MTEPAQVTIVTTPAPDPAAVPVTPPWSPLPVDSGPSAPRRPAAVTVAARPPALLRPVRRRSGPALLARLARLLRLGRSHASHLTAEDLRVLAALGIAVVVALGGQADLDITAPAPSSTAAPAVPAADGNVTTAARVLDLARAEIGTTEARSGATPYHRAFGLAPSQPWCAAFVWDVVQEAGGPGSIPKTAYTPAMATWFRERGQWTADPVVGALVFFDFPDSKHRIQHVGIVEAVGRSTITTIEGNTGPGATGSQDNGDGVYRRERRRNGSIVGYGLPVYSLADRT